MEKKYIYVVADLDEEIKVFPTLDRVKGHLRSQLKESGCWNVEDYDPEDFEKAKWNEINDLLSDINKFGKRVEINKYK